LSRMLSNVPSSVALRVESRMSMRARAGMRRPYPPRAALSTKAKRRRFQAGPRPRVY
jgi:hypothetical protein